MNFAALHCDPKTADPLYGLPQRNWWRKATANKRALPKVIIAGVQKGGTTSLYAWLHQHPQVMVPSQKELYFFSNSSVHQKGLQWYRSFFPVDQPHKMAIDASANTFEEPAAAVRIKQDLPQAKVVVLLRNPVQRAWSHYKMAVRLGFEKAPFYEALQLENERIQQGNTGVHNYLYQRLGYCAKGQYARLLQPWLSVCGPKEIMVRSSEAFFADPQKNYAQLLEFCNLDPVMPDQFKAFNSDESGGKMDQRSKEYLEAYFEPYNRALFDLMDQQYNW